MKPRLEKVVAGKQRRLAVETIFFSRNELARPVLGTIFSSIWRASEARRHSQVCTIKNRGYTM